jgi:peptide/nickel transport system substrate-binding protein
MQYCSVVPKKIVEHYGPDFREHPVGAGPFTFNRWKEGEALLLARNKDYYRTKNGEQLPYLDGVRVTFQQDKQVEFLRFKKGKIHFVSGIEGKYKDQVLTKQGKLKPKHQDQFKMLKATYLNTEYLGFLMKDEEGEPVFSKKVRKAINYGFDREKMIEYLRNGIGVPARHGFVPPVLLGEEHAPEG